MAPPGGDPRDEHVAVGVAEVLLVLLHQLVPLLVARALRGLEVVVVEDDHVGRRHHGAPAARDALLAGRVALRGEQRHRDVGAPRHVAEHPRLEEHPLSAVADADVGDVLVVERRHAVVDGRARDGGQPVRVEEHARLVQVVLVRQARARAPSEAQPVGRQEVLAGHARVGLVEVEAADAAVEHPEPVGVPRVREHRDAVDARVARLDGGQEEGHAHREAVLRERDDVLVGAVGILVPRLAQRARVRAKVALEAPSVHVVVAEVRHVQPLLLVLVDLGGALARRARVPLLLPSERRLQRAAHRGIRAEDGVFRSRILVVRPKGEVLVGPRDGRPRPARPRRLRRRPGVGLLLALVEVPARLAPAVACRLPLGLLVGALAPHAGGGRPVAQDFVQAAHHLHVGEAVDGGVLAHREEGVDAALPRLPARVHARRNVQPPRANLRLEPRLDAAPPVRVVLELVLVVAHEALERLAHRDGRQKPELGALVDLLHQLLALVGLDDGHRRGLSLPDLRRAHGALGKGARNQPLDARRLGGRHRMRAPFEASLPADGVDDVLGASAKIVLALEH